MTLHYGSLRGECLGTGILHKNSVCLFFSMIVSNTKGTLRMLIYMEPILSNLEIYFFQKYILLSFVALGRLCLTVFASTFHPNISMVCPIF